MFERPSQRAQEVIFFISDTGVSKEMMFTEFEAVLDGVVGLQEFANTTSYCVFSVINPGLQPQAFVFFTIDFDENGEPPSTWNLPFQTLIQKANPVTFGSYQAKVITQSSCSTEWHKTGLWDPSEQVVAVICEAIQANKLCLSTESMDGQARQQSIPSFATQPAAQFAASVPVHSRPSHIQSSQGHSLPELMKEVAAQLSGVQDVDRDASRRLEKELGETIKTLTVDLHAMTQRATELEQKNLALMEESFKQKSSFSQMRADLEQSLDEKIKLSVAEARQALKTKYEKKLKTYEQEYKNRYTEKVSAMKNTTSASTQAVQDMQNMLQDKDRMLDEKNHRIDHLEERHAEDALKLREQAESIDKLEAKMKQMSEELAMFRKEKLRLMADGADKFFEKLENSGLNFIAYHPGAGHISVSVKQVAEYIENPQIFAAEKVGLSLEAYQYWLGHYEKPCCQAPIIGGKTCGQKIQRHDNPRDFSPGISDRCEKHKTGISATQRVFSS